MRKSVEFEQLVAVIIGELEPTAEVKWDDHIVGQLSGRIRQIDVSIRRRDPDFLGIIDAKDYGRRATIDRIDALSGVMRDVQAQYGALVCSGGFSNSIHQYARNCGISLFNAHDARSANWSLELKIPIIWTELTPLVSVAGEFEFQAGDQVPRNDRHGIQMSTDGGQTIVDPLGTFEQAWNQGSLSQQPGVVHRAASAQKVEALVRDAADKPQLRPVHNFGFIYEVQSKTWLGKFQPEDCRGLVDYLNGQAFYASFLPVSAVPYQRDEQWEHVDDPDQLAITATGTLVVCTTPLLISNTRITNMSVDYIGPLPGAHPDGAES
ncbi:hypothetical protein E1218_29830 [Kribbella turkmenica]|uniref:Restriction endonuclease type IV Mrr domain-containing protein n=1 Tax=Kribbella turkmenica TaxID=2530375 RepID=A0A4R4WC39_9ACTN|nr:restriction endonuclease [Kribbella turkmenica]TDD16428.1 hypothetical protein E1218_29830 [Kribbella turkmenica]